MTSFALILFVLTAFSGFTVYTVSAEVRTFSPFAISGSYSITNSFTLCEESIVSISACENAYSGDPMFYVYMNGVYQYTGDNYNGYYCPRVDNQILTPPLGSCVDVIIYNYCVGSGTCSGTLTATIESTAGTHRPSMPPTRQPTSAPLRYCPAYSASGRSTYTTCSISVCQRSQLTVSTCPRNGGQYSGDTLLSLYQGSTFVASNDDDPNNGACSTISTTVEPVNGQCTIYSVQEACFQTYCAGTVAYSLTTSTTPTALPTTRPTFGPSMPPTSYCASYTATSRAGYTSCFFSICQPASITASTCTSEGGQYTGDTYLMMYVNGVFATQNDDSIGGGACSTISTYVVTPTNGQCSTIDLKQSCFSTSCSGRTVFKVNYNYASLTRQPTVAPTRGPRIAAATVFRLDNVQSYSLSTSDQNLLNTAILLALQQRTQCSFTISDAVYSVLSTTMATRTLRQRLTHWGARALSAIGVAGSMAPTTTTLSLWYTATLVVPSTYCVSSTPAASCAAFLGADLQLILGADTIDSYLATNAPSDSSLVAANSASIYVSSYRDTSSSSSSKKKKSSSGTTAIVASVSSVFGWLFFVFVIFAATAAARNRSRVNPGGVGGDPFAAAAFDPNKNVQMVAMNAPPASAMPISDPYAVQNYASATASYPFASPTPMAFAMPQLGASVATTPGAPSWNTAPTVVGAGYGTTTDYYAAASVPMAPLTTTTTATTGAPHHSAASEPHSVSHHATDAATAPTVVPAPYVLPSTTYSSSVAAFNPASYASSSSTTTSAALGGALGGAHSGATAPSASSLSSVPTYSTYPYPTVPSLTAATSATTGASAAAPSATATSSYASYSPYTPYTPYTPGAAHP